MCGISGTLGLTKYEVVSHMIRAIQHRGPDEPPNFHKVHTYIGAACRLSIVDVADGSQPVADEASQTCLSLNGEIYNYKALRQQLVKRGHHFRTRGDTEVALRAYLEYGIDFIHHLAGMFAIALYDARLDVLYLIRDRMGIKPLYYVQTPEGVAYSSELKSFFAAKLPTGEVDLEYLAHRYVFDVGPLNKTLFTNIRPVEPGTYVKCDNYSLVICHYRQHEVATTDGPRYREDFPEATAQTIRQLLLDSVRERIPAEVPWGSFLSGGIDSSILAFAAKEVASSRPSLYTIADETETDDLLNSRAVAGFLNLPLVELRVEAADILNSFPAYILAMEEFQTVGMFWYVMAQKARPHIKVALCGQGADELFGGYPVYRNLQGVLTQYGGRLRVLKKKVAPDVCHIAECRLNSFNASHSLQPFYNFYLHEQLAGFQLRAVDRCSMASGLETRVPFLAERVVNYVDSIPIETIFADRLEKHLLRIAFDDSKLPTLRRRKLYAGIGTIPKFYNRMSKMVADTVSDDIWQNHPFSHFFKTKLELLSFDILMFLLRECNGEIPDGFQMEALYCDKSYI